MLCSQQTPRLHRSGKAPGRALVLFCGKNASHAPLHRARQRRRPPACSELTFVMLPANSSAALLWEGAWARTSAFLRAWFACTALHRARQRPTPARLLGADLCYVASKPLGCTALGSRLGAHRCFSACMACMHKHCAAPTSYFDLPGRAQTSFLSI